MLSKKSTICFGFNDACLALESRFIPSISSCSNRSDAFSYFSRCRAFRPIRCYGTLHHDDQTAWGTSKDNRLWHPSWPKSPKPTPYEILGQLKSAPYNKARYLELVKIYHPDRSHLNDDDGVPNAIKVDRYRLVVAANQLLKDPSRRRLYDLYGIGWECPQDHTQRVAAERAWREEAGNASQNATWEDWESWYWQRDGKPGGEQAPQYMSNGAFVGVLTVCVVIAAWGQATRRGTHGLHIVERKNEMDENIFKEMRMKRAQTDGMSPKDRIDTFLRRREGWDAPKVAHSVAAPHGSRGSSA